MVLNSDIRAFDRVTDPVFQLLTDDQLRQIQELQSDPAVEERIEELASKANEGELTPEERREYVGYIQANSLLVVLQAQARKHLQSQGSRH